jgi:hypothetical protein
LVFIGLNPSTANEERSDPTIRRVSRFAKDNGYGGFQMLNLFTLVSSKPEILLTHPNPLLNANEALEYPALFFVSAVFAWGAFKQARERAKEVIPMFPDALCLGKNADGSPKHPLYVKADQPLIKFKEI